MTRAYFRLPFVGYASSSVVDTIGTLSLRISSICGSTVFSDELVQCTTTSGLAALIAFFTSSETFTRSGLRELRDVAEIAARLGGIDVDGPDDAKALAPGDLSHDGRTDWPEPDVHDLDRSRL